MQDPLKLADQNYTEGNYAAAIGLFENALAKNSEDSKTQLKLAQCYYLTKDYKKSISTYDALLRKKNSLLSQHDMYYYAQAQSALQHYPVAIDYYKRCLANEPDNEL